MGSGTDAPEGQGGDYIVRGVVLNFGHELLELLEIVYLAAKDPI